MAYFCSIAALLLFTITVQHLLGEMSQPGLFHLLLLLLFTVPFTPQHPTVFLPGQMTATPPLVSPLPATTVTPTEVRPLARSLWTVDARQSASCQGGNLRRQWCANNHVHTPSLHVHNALVSTTQPNQCFC